MTEYKRELYKEYKRARAIGHNATFAYMWATMMVWESDFE